jgi:hypothetical protein
MQHDCGGGVRLDALAVFVFLLTFPLETASAKKQPKAYPEEGKIVATSINQVTRTRTYNVVTEARAYEFDCGIHPDLFSSTPGECGGDKKLQIGNVIHFRFEKGRAYIPVSKTVEPAGEQGLRVIREELRPNATPADYAPAPQPASPGTSKP